MDVEEFFRDETLESTMSWKPALDVVEWLPSVPFEEAPDNIETKLGSRSYRGRFFGKQEYAKSYLLTEATLSDVIEHDITWTCGTWVVSLMELMTDYSELLRNNSMNGPRVLFHFQGNIRAIILRLMQPIRYITIETCNMRDFSVRRGLGMPIEKMKRMPQVSVGASRFSISVVSAAEISSDFGYDTLPPKVLDMLEAHVSRDYYQVYVRGITRCVARLNSQPVWYSRTFNAFDDGSVPHRRPSYHEIGKVHVALFDLRKDLPDGMLVDGDHKWSNQEVQDFLGISEIPQVPEVPEVIAPVIPKQPRLKGKSRGKKVRKELMGGQQASKDGDLWAKLASSTLQAVGSLDDLSTYQGVKFLAYSRDHAKINMDKVRLILRGLRDLLGNIFVIAPGDGIGIASRVCSEMALNGVFGDIERCAYTATNVIKESINDTLIRGRAQSGCSSCRNWDICCSTCKERPVPVVLLSYVMAFMREKTVWTTLAHVGFPAVIIDSPYRVPYAPAMRKQAGVWVVNSLYPSSVLWTSWQVPTVTHPRGYFVPYTNALVEPRRWGYVEDTASLLYLASIYPGSEVSNYSQLPEDQVRGFLGNLGLRYAERSDADIILINQDHDDEFEGRWRLDLRTGHYSRGEAYVPFDPMSLPSSRSLHRGSIYRVTCEIASVIGPVGYRKADNGCTTFWCMDLRGQTKATMTFRSGTLVSRVHVVFHGD